MDWNFAIERNREALQRVLLAVVAMAGLAAPGLPFSPCGSKRRAAIDAEASIAVAQGWPREARSDEGCARPTLPRHLHRAVLRLLRPAEAAARRLVIMAARGLVVALPASRPRKPTPKQPSFHPGSVTGIWMPPHLRPAASRAPPALRASALPLFDPLPRWGGSRRKPASGMPRICTPGWSTPAPVPPERQSKGRRPPAPDDAIDATRLALRLQALGSALDDLPREARRFARWRMRTDAAIAGEKDGSPARPRRVWPLKPGGPPGAGRRTARRAVHAVHDVLGDTHALAIRAMENPDTS